MLLLCPNKKLLLVLERFCFLFNPFGNKHCYSSTCERASHMYETSFNVFVSQLFRFPAFSFFSSVLRASLANIRCQQSVQVCYANSRHVVFLIRSILISEASPLKIFPCANRSSVDSKLFACNRQINFWYVSGFLTVCDR